jgi:hypothetical protein
MEYKHLNWAEFYKGPYTRKNPVSDLTVKTEKIPYPQGHEFDVLVTISFRTQPDRLSVMPELGGLLLHILQILLKRAKGLIS